MTIFNFAGRSIELAAALVAPKAETMDCNAWAMGQFATVRLLTPTEALRVHTQGRAYPGRAASASMGGWVALGDVIQTADALASSRSLPTANPSSATAFTHVNSVVIPAGSVINIGVASDLFGGRGGGFQGEYVSGPALQFRPLTGKHWHNKYGSA